jgi:hypothetical protein
MTKPTLFISYSRKDEAFKDELQTHLSVLGKADLLRLWSDDQIGAGADWEVEIGETISQAKVAILLITANFLASDFILRKEVPALLNRCEQEGLLIFPVIAKACAWKHVEWLARLNVRPRNARPVWSDHSSHVDEDLAGIADEIATLIKQPKSATLPTPPPSPISPKRSDDVPDPPPIGPMEDIAAAWRG